MRHNKSRAATARHKLNSASMMGTLVVAGLLGGLAGSWLVFLVAALVMAAAAVHAGDIRR